MLLAGWVLLVIVGNLWRCLVIFSHLLMVLGYFLAIFDYFRCVLSDVGGSVGIDDACW